MAAHSSKWGAVIDGDIAHLRWRWHARAFVVTAAHIVVDDGSVGRIKPRNAVTQTQVYNLLGGDRPEVPVPGVKIFGGGHTAIPGDPELRQIKSKMHVSLIIIPPGRVGRDPIMIAGVQTLIDVNAHVINQNRWNDMTFHQIGVASLGGAGERRNQEFPPCAEVL